MHHRDTVRYRPSPSFASIMAVLLAAGAAGAWAWHKAGAAPPEARAQMGFWECLNFKHLRNASAPAADQLARHHQQILALKNKLTAEFPALKAAARPVADDENGFLLLYKLSGNGLVHGNLPLSEEFKQILRHDAPWNPESARRCLAGHAALVSRIEHIAALTTRSSSNMPPDFTGFVGSKAAKSGSDILLLKARLAAEAGDDSETRRLAAAASNLAAHFREVETPSLLEETVVIVIDRDIAKVAFTSLLPALGGHADLGRWQTLFDKRSCTPADLAQVIRGEWNIGAEHFVLPVLLASERNHELPDAEAVARTYSSWVNDCVTRLPACGLADVDRVFQQPAEVAHLSKAGREIIRLLASGLAAWTNGYVYAAAVRAQYQAALDLLILEQAGAKLTASDGGKVTCDPVSGLPFVFDPAKRTLAPPPATADLKIEPLALPW